MSLYKHGLDVLGMAVGSEPAKYTTTRATSFFVSPTQGKYTGSSKDVRESGFDSNKGQYVWGFDEVKNGRRRVRIAPDSRFPTDSVYGGFDFWVRVEDLASGWLPEIWEDYKKKSDAYFQDHPLPSTKATRSAKVEAAKVEAKKAADTVEKAKDAVPDAAAALASPDVASFLQREYGGLPVWGWGAIGLGTFTAIGIGVKVLRGRKAYL